jgi:histidyl-tRNA synthetase
LLRELGISEGVTLKLNTLGDVASRDAWRAALVAHFEAHRSELSEDSVARLEKNPLRILDSKDPRDRPAADSAPKMVLSGEAEDFFGKVREGLDAAGVAYEIAPHLVRGLDYYRHTAFEFVTDRLGAQGTVLGGGRYDGLIETLGGPHTPAVGWAAGIERLGMLLSMACERPPTIAVLPNKQEFVALSGELASILTNAGISCVHPYSFRNPQKQFDRFWKAGIPFVLDLTSPDTPDGICHARIIYGGTSFDENRQIAVDVEAALEKRFQLKFMGEGPRSSSGWDLLVRI